MGSYLTYLSVHTATEEETNKLLKTIQKSREDYIKNIRGRDQDDSGSDEKSPLSENEAEMKSLDLKDYTFPFENLIFKGGGSKCISYFGAARVLEKCGIFKNIRRFAGSSAGAAVAALMAIGANHDDFIEVFGSDLGNIDLGNKKEVLSWVGNLFRGYGLTAALTMYERSGQLIAKRTNGNPDLTIGEFYELTGKEICLVASNINTMEEEYFHVKTTPNVPIRLAIRSAMTVPGILQAVEVTTFGRRNTFVDGGLACNSPIHCYDGWWLSMDPEDAFFKRLHPTVKSLHHLDRRERFKRRPSDNRTLGLVVFNEYYKTIENHRYNKINKRATKYPDSKLARMKKDSATANKQEAREYRLVHKALDELIKAIEKKAVHGEDKIRKCEMRKILQGTDFKEKYFRLLFGEDVSAETVVEAIYNRQSDFIDYQMLLQFIEDIGISFKERMVVAARHKITGIMSYFNSFQLLLRENNLLRYAQSKDLERIVGINTGYIETYNLLEDADYEFLLQSGENAMDSYLRHYVVENKLEKRNHSKQ